MAVNITITGNIYDESGIKFTGAEVAYQVYFYNGAAGGSNSTWSDKRFSILGQYNFNLADLDLLTTAGNVSDGDLVVVVFWTPASASRLDSCGVLDMWSCYIVTLGSDPGMISSDLYVNDVQVRGNVCPTLRWTFPTDGLVGQSLTAGNTSTDQYQWDFSGTTMWHRDSWYTTLMTINNVNNTDLDWDDGIQNNNLSGPASRSHTYTASGDYDVEIVIEDGCGCTVTGTQSIRIKNRPPVPNIEMTPANPLPNEVIEFRYTGTDPDYTITNIAWTINDGDTNTISSTNGKDDIVPHSSGEGTDWYTQAPNPGAFTNPGNHLVSIVITWWDGFEDQPMNYSENFTQQKFSGPVVNFTQDPEKAKLDELVIFTNTSTNTDRVGLGLPDNLEYKWKWTDGSASVTHHDKPFDYKLEKTPITASCKVKLCAQWSDGWDTHEVCVEKDVVFDTTVTISPEDCYYNLNIIGTSDDGSVTGYGWTVYSGSGQSGPWTATWSSPQGLEQNDKKICFTSVGWYKIEGTVYGNGNSTSDDDILYVTTVCPAGGSVYNLWNGTGIQDVGADWQHSGFGIETEGSKHTGTYGLDASGLTQNRSITFTAPGVSNIPLSDYDFLRVWINLQSLPSNSEIDLEFKTVGSKNGNTLNLVNYLDTSKIGIWQKVMVPVDDFAFAGPGETYLNKLIFSAGGQMSFWLDDISLTIGTYEKEVVPICSPVIYGREVDESKKMIAREIKPSIKGRPSIQNSPRIIQDSLRPFPRPRNL